MVAAILFILLILLFQKTMSGFTMGAVRQIRDQMREDQRKKLIFSIKFVYLRLVKKNDANVSHVLRKSRTRNNPNKFLYV